ncbi:peptidyl-prolyl cis-trans isomerase, cyclophilin-type [Gregarina niphandrodes]|uniref:peptidylprolyl isomerase n=1 Tax=Gregarina niphandrodes TaxID=110365 RepID=A0A023B7F7_GRENI|nr:peptidyl-prolyl cis-trans isomerase, cyclophilin-type [Gregarina niphandrodes]EZG67244.1 peptidyl-prolyl cis-trans isomerase, cyclophilin-type [Gregarina niphandrodes]|eukprot:XP_011130289.1 peptidyl-prolyl cis-trans isomerase, cyclophilin-type [Gregarina niphandrodes]
MAKRNPRVFLEFQFGNKKAGIVVIELFANVVPKTAANFEALCTGSRGVSSETKLPLCYAGCKVFKVIPGQFIQCGDIEYNNGRGGESIYGRTFEDENFSLWHAYAGVVSMCNDGPNTNGSQFYITLKWLPHMNRRNVVVGQVRMGMEILRAMEKIPVDERDIPKIPILVSGCGLYEGSTRREISDPAVKQGEALLQSLINGGPKPRNALLELTKAHIMRKKALENETMKAMPEGANDQSGHDQGGIDNNDQGGRDQDDNIKSDNDQGDMAEGERHGVSNELPAESAQSSSLSAALPDRTEAKGEPMGPNPEPTVDGKGWQGARNWNEERSGDEERIGEEERSGEERRRVDRSRDKGGDSELQSRLHNIGQLMEDVKHLDKRLLRQGHPARPVSRIEAASIEFRDKYESVSAAEAAREHMRELDKAERRQYNFSVWSEHSVYRSYEKKLARLQKSRVATSPAAASSALNEATGQLAYNSIGVVAHAATTATGNLGAIVSKTRIKKKTRPTKLTTVGDVNYINRRNQLFNKTLEKAYGEYVHEIRQNLERGTAL